MQPPVFPWSNLGAKSKSSSEPPLITDNKEKGTISVPTSELITSVEIFHVTNPSLRPTIVRITTDAGTIGLGDCGVSYGGGTTALAPLSAELASNFVLGRRLSERNQIQMDLTHDTFWAKRAGSLIGGAISALDQAVQDAAARSLGVPLYELLGGKVRDDVEVYSNGWYFGQSDEDALMRAALRAVQDGHRALKFYPMARQDEHQRLHHPSPGSFGPVLIEEALERTRSLRRTVGDEVRIMVDLAGCMPRDLTTGMLHALAELSVEFVEEPFSPADDSSYDWIAKSSPVPLAAGERYCGFAPFERAINSGAVQILQPDISLIGGHRIFQAVAELALAHSVRLSPHNCASGVSTAHTLHAAATVPNLHSVETFPYLSAASGYQEILTNPLEAHIEGGVLPLPDSPGIGVDLNDAVMDRFRILHLRAADHGA